MNQSINSLTFLLVADENNHLTPLSSVENLNDWGTNIGFEFPPFNFLSMAMENYSDAIKFDGVSFNTENGCTLPELIVQTHDEIHINFPDKATFPMYSVINFDTVPPRCCCTIMLQSCIASRLGHEDTNNREELISVASRVHLLSKPLLEPNKSPLKIYV